MNVGSEMLKFRFADPVTYNGFNWHIEGYGFSTDGEYTYHLLRDGGYMERNVKESKLEVQGEN